MPPPHHQPHPPHHHAPPFVPYSASTPAISINSGVKPSKRVTVAKPLVNSSPTFSGFKGLSVLAILDMDTLEYVSEIAECIRGSSGTLKELRLSFSETLALKSRKKVIQESDTETAPDDDELFDDNGDLPNPAQPGMALNTPPIFGPGNASTDADVRRERTAQEKALARMFGLEKDDPKTKKLEKAAEDAIANADKEAQEVLKTSARQDADTLFVKDLKLVMNNMLQKHSGNSLNPSKVQRILENMDKAATEYLKGCEEAEMAPKKPKSAPVSPKKYSYQTYKHKPGPPSYPAQHPPQGMVGLTGHNMELATHYFPTGPGHSANFHPDLDIMVENASTGLAENAIYSSGGPSNPNKPPKAYPWSAHPKKIVIKKKDGGTHTMYKGSHEYNAFYGPHGLPKTSVTKGKGKALSTQSSSFSSTSGLGWDEQDGLPVIPTANSSEVKLPKDEFEDDIDMATPDVADEDDCEDQEFLETPESSGENHIDGGDDDDESTDSTPIPHSKTNGVMFAPFDFEISPGKGKGKARDIDSSPSKGKGKGKGKEIEKLSPALAPGSKNGDASEEPISSEQAIQEYVRLNHGIPLEKLSIYLIPVKPSTLFRAIDFGALKSISLLNVGPQRALWAALTKLQKLYPLQLKSIYVDNVTPSFLVFLGGLESELEELFMLERPSRTKVEPFAPKTLVGIEDIRKQALKKHMKTLKRLVIRNDEDATWALNKETVRLLTKEGQNLRELVIALAPPTFVSPTPFNPSPFSVQQPNIPSQHFLMQTLSPLVSLRALQIISVSAGDNCHSVIREIRQCAIDNISHYPQLQIEYVALSSMGNGSTNLTRLVRKDKERKWDNRVGLGKKSMSSGLGLDIDDDDEDDGLRFRVVELRLKDAVGVKIWEKEILGGRL
jgi:hypothetical protein